MVASYGLDGLYIESQLSAEEKLARLQEPGKTIFVCINEEADDWVGQVTLIGPLTRSEYDQPFRVIPGTESAKSPALDDSTSTDAYWHMTALYVDDRIRGRGLARLLCNECFRYIGSGQLRIIIKPDNIIVLLMYERMGFEIQQDKAALLEAIHASRDGVAKLPPQAHLDPTYTQRGGIVMIKRIQTEG
ncbi:hypothetical protein NDA16_001537 [Ustilago loliicola]|nr:hypothetical protein NDA16_001537 [Ustilago loliicola]